MLSVCIQTVLEGRITECWNKFCELLSSLLPDIVTKDQFRFEFTIRLNNIEAAVTGAKRLIDRWLREGMLVFVPVYGTQRFFLVCLQLVN